MFEDASEDDDVGAVSIAEALRQDVAILSRCRHPVAKQIRVIAENTLRGEDIDSQITNWLKRAYPTTLNSRKEYVGSREIRRQKYAVMQKKFHKSMQDAFKIIMNNDDTETLNIPDFNPMMDFWSEQFSGGGTP